MYVVAVAHYDTAVTNARIDEDDLYTLKGINLLTWGNLISKTTISPILIH